MLQTEVAVQMNPHPTRPAGFKKISVLQWTCLALLLAASSWVRLHGLKENGIVGSDTFQYWDIATMWENGEFALNNDLKEYRQYFRPTFYSLNVLALKIFGVQDYALRGLIGVFETINVLLAFAIGYYFFRRSFWMGFCVAAFYAAIPSAILLSQIELPHSYSTTFALGMFLCFVLAHEHNAGPTKLFSRKWLFAAGLCGGLAATTHGSTTFFGPTLVLLLGTQILLQKAWTWSQKWREGLASLGLLTLGFALPYVLWGALVGYGYMVRAINSERTIRDAADLDRFSLLWKYLTQGPKESISAPVLYLFLGSALYSGWLALRKRATILNLSPLLIVLCFSFLFSMVFQNVFYTRIYLPLNLFVVLSIFFAVHQLATSITSKWAPALAALVMLPIGYFTCTAQINNIKAHYRGERKGVPRITYDVIGTQVNENAKLLVTPYTQYFHRPQFKARAYFGQNALYLMECGQMSLREYVAQNQIKFVVVSKDIDRRIMESKDNLYKNLGSCHGIAREDYSLEKDLQALYAFLKDTGAVKLEMKASEGELYALP